MKKKRGFWGWSRRVFRWFRIFVWLLVLLVAGSLLYLNRIGLPGFLKTRVVAALQAEGLNTEFARLRLSGYRHLIIERMSLVATNTPAPVQFNAQNAELKFNGQALRRFEFKLESLHLRDGTLVMNLEQTNAPARSLVVSNIVADVRTDSEDRWTLSAFEGDALGARWTVSGSLTNVLWIASRPSKGTGQQMKGLTPVLRDVVETIDKIQFSTAPQITMTALGDLKELSTFKASLSVRSSGAAKTPWGDVDTLVLRSSLGPGGAPGQQMEATLTLHVKKATTVWGGLSDADLQTRTEYPLTNSAKFDSAWSLRAQDVELKWYSGRDVDVTLSTRQAGTNLITTLKGNAANGRTIFGAADRSTIDAQLEHGYPVRALNKFLFDLLPVQPAITLPPAREELLSLGQHWAGNWKISFDGLRTKSGAAGKLNITGDVRERSDRVKTEESWGFWREIADLLMDWRAEAVDFRSNEAHLDRVVASGVWRAPNLTMTGVDSELYGGSFHAKAALDVISRKVTAEAKSDFDIKQIAWLLDEEVRPFLKVFTWEKPPRIEAHAELTAPPWVTPPGNWRDNMIASASLNGSLAIGKASFRGVECNAFSTDFSLTNFVWHLPNATLTRPEGTLEVDFTGHSFEPQFRIAMRGGIDPWAAMPLLSEDAQAGLKFVEFKQAPFIDGVLTGDFTKPELLKFEGALAGTNIVARGEPFLDFKARAVYATNWIYITDPVAHRTTNEVLSASTLTIDLDHALLFLTNGFSTTDPYKVTKVIGPITYNAIAPYHFASPPSVRAEGTIPLADAHDADIHFQIDGDVFNYWRFNVTGAKAGVYWHHEFLDVTNVTAKFYGGEMEWEGHFTFLQDDNANYRFKGICTNADLSLLLHDLIPEATNKLEGTLHGTLVITDANTDSIQTWKGHGEGVLKDGFLWDIPVFGIFSEPLNTLAPGFGKSRIYGGTATFKVDSGKVFTKDMEVRAPAFRLKYDGSVDFDGNLDAKVEAQFFRNTWIIGRAMSAAFWPLAKAFESKVTGSLAAPKSELAHIPKIMLFPLRPVQTLKEALGKDKEKKTPAEPEPK